MNVQSWFDGGCDYDLGVEIYAQIGKNVILIRNFKKGKTSYNVEKLKHELSKFSTVSTPITPKVKPMVNVEATVVEKYALPASPEVKRMAVKPISFYPKELHGVYQRRVQSFYESASLKSQLNDLDEEKEEEALVIQFKIWALIKENEKCWRILKHFDETNRIMADESQEDYSDLSPQERVNQRQRLYVNQSRRKSTLINKELELDQEANPAKRLKLEDFINRKKEELQVIENDIEQLTKLINE